MDERPSKCPKCGNSSIAEIYYGYPPLDEELDRELDAGLVVLGGCCVTGNDPAWHCNDCEYEF